MKKKRQENEKKPETSLDRAKKPAIMRASSTRE